MNRLVANNSIHLIVDSFSVTKYYIVHTVLLNASLVATQLPLIWIEPKMLSAAVSNTKFRLWIVQKKNACIKIQNTMYCLIDWMPIRTLLHAKLLGDLWREFTIQRFSLLSDNFKWWKNHCNYNWNYYIFYGAILRNYKKQSKKKHFSAKHHNPICSFAFNKVFFNCAANNVTQRLKPIRRLILFSSLNYINKPRTILRLQFLSISVVFNWSSFLFEWKSLEILSKSAVDIYSLNSHCDKLSR